MLIMKWRLREGLQRKARTQEDL